MGRLEQLALGIAPRWMIDLASRGKAGARNTVAGRRYGPLVEQLLPDATQHELLVANADAVVMRVQFADRNDSILKIATSEIASEQIAIEAAALDELAQRTALAGFRDLVAKLEQRGEYEGGTWFTQSCLDGIPTSELTMNAADQMAACISALTPLHEATGVNTIADDEVLNELVTEPIETLRTWRPALSNELTVINGECRQRLASLELTLSRQHGDFAPSNVLWDPETSGVSGIVDWKLAIRPLPSEVDYVHYALSLMMQHDNIEYGDTVIAMLGDGAASDKAAPVRLAIEWGPNNLDVRTAVTLAWLQHISFGLHKAPDLRTNPIWLGNNIDNVIQALCPNGS